MVDGPSDGKGLYLLVNPAGLQTVALESIRWTAFEQPACDPVPGEIVDKIYSHSRGIISNLRKLLILLGSPVLAHFVLPFFASGSVVAMGHNFEAL